MASPRMRTTTCSRSARAKPRRHGRWMPCRLRMRCRGRACARSRKPLSPVPTARPPRSACWRRCCVRMACAPATAAPTACSSMANGSRPATIPARSARAPCCATRGCRRRGFVVHRRIGCADTERRIQRPLVHFGGDVELVGRRREGKRCAAGMFAHDDRARGPTERCPRPRDVVAPALPGVGIECQSGRGFQRRAGAIEVEVGAGQPARILERFAHDARLNRTLRARSAARARRAPRLPSPRPVARPGWSPAAAPRCARWRRACRHPA